MIYEKLCKMRKNTLPTKCLLPSYTSVIIPTDVQWCIISCIPFYYADNLNFRIIQCV